MEQYERAQQDPVYVQELIIAFGKEQDSGRNTLREEYDVSIPDSIINEDNEVSVPVDSEDIEENMQSDVGKLFIWSDSCILLLLTLYEEKKEEFTNKRHKFVFNEIAKKMHNTNPTYKMTGSQCQSKMNILKKTYKKFLDHNMTSGNDRVTWPYFDRMNEIFGQTGWANPVATASEAGPSNTTTPTNEKEKASKRKLNFIFDDCFKSKYQIMSERLEVKKENMKLKREQHREKMEILKTICHSLNNK